MVSDMYANTCCVSVIVPIYKAEDTLLRCLDSLKVQTLTDFEVLMVDDGSPDRCGEMIDEYAAKDSRFKAYHKPNGGVSSARQYGIDHACGEYTIHADPDDWVEPTMLEELYGKAKEENADMVICDFYENTYKGQKYIIQEPSSLNHSDVMRDLFFRIHGSTCNKLIRRKVYYDYKIKFPLELSVCEDQYVLASILKNNIKVVYLPKAFYHYVRELNLISLSRNYNEKTYQEDLFRRDYFCKLLKDEPFLREFYDKNTYTIVSRAFHYGYNFYTSKCFKKQFYPNINIIKNAHIPIVEKKMLVWSCRGYYGICFFFFNSLLYIKHKLC